MHEHLLVLITVLSSSKLEYWTLLCRIFPSEAAALRADVPLLMPQNEEHFIPKWAMLLAGTIFNMLMMARLSVS